MGQRACSLLEKGLEGWDRKVLGLGSIPVSTVHVCVCIYIYIVRYKKKKKERREDEDGYCAYFILAS